MRNHWSRKMVCLGAEAAGRLSIQPGDPRSLNAGAWEGSACVCGGGRGGGGESTGERKERGNVLRSELCTHGL